MDAHLQQWQAAGNAFEHQGRSVFYRDEGQGPVLLCIHGYPTASWDWHRIWPRMVDRYRVIAPDMLGFGFSDKPRDFDYSIAGQATLHEQLLAALGIDEIHVLAHDYGDTVAQELIARQHERTQRGEPGLRLRTVCLLNGGLFPETHRARPIQTLLRSPLGPLLVRVLDERAFRRSFKALFGADTQPGDGELARFWALIDHNGGRANLGRLLHYIGERRRHRARWVGAPAWPTPCPARTWSSAIANWSRMRTWSRCRASVITRNGRPPNASPMRCWHSRNSATARGLIA